MSEQPSRPLFYAQLLVVASLPFHFLFSSYAIGLLILLFIIELIRSHEFRNGVFKAFRNNQIAILLTLFFLMYALSALIHYSSYDSNTVETAALEKKLSFILFPFLFASFANASYTQVRLTLKVFVISILISTFFALCDGLFQTIHSGSLYYFDDDKHVLFNNFMYHRLGSYVGMHAVYFAEYVLLTFIVTVSFTYYHFANWNTKNRLLSVLIVFYLIGTIFLLKSAAVLIILLVIISLFTTYYLYQARKNVSRSVKWVVPIIAFIIVAVLSYRAIDKIGSKASFFTYDFSEPGGGNWNAINLRLAKWDVAQMAIKDHWLLGVGPGNIISTLDTYYEKVGFSYALQLHYNPHNQLLHTLLTLGIIGFLLLIGIYILAIINSLRKKDSVMFLFMVSFLLFSMSESTLAVNKGIVFFSVFLTFFSYLPKKVSYYLNERSHTE